VIELTSSSKLGKIFLFLSLSEKLGNTLSSPLRKVAFSSLGFELNVDRSRKRRVEMARLEKKGWEGSVRAESLLVEVRVMRLERRSTASQITKHSADVSERQGIDSELTFQIASQLRHRRRASDIASS